jgi:hypothetical protein
MWENIRVRGGRERLIVGFPHTILYDKV